MKKIIFALCLGCSMAAQAQNLRWGVKAGLNINDPSGNYNGGPETHYGPAAGIKGEFAFKDAAKGLYVMAGLEWSQKGYKSPIFSTDGVNDIKGEAFRENISVNYLEMPLHIGYKIPCSGRISILGEAGPYIAYAAWGKETLNHPDYESYNTSRIFGDGGFKRFDTGIGLNIGIQIDRHYQIMAGYERGFVNQVKNDKSDPAFSKATYRNNNFNFTVAYIF